MTVWRYRCELDPSCSFHALTNEPDERAPKRVPRRVNSLGDEDVVHHDNVNVVNALLLKVLVRFNVLGHLLAACPRERPWDADLYVRVGICVSQLRRIL